MTHKELLNDVQKVCHLDAVQCSTLLTALCRLMSKAGVEGIPVTLPGLGTFTSHKHPEYIQENPKTGVQTLYPPRISYRMHVEEESADLSSQPALLEHQLADQSKATVDESSRFLAALTQTIYDAVDRGEEVEVHGLGSFRIVASRQGELQRIAYTPDESMKSAVNAPFSCFEPIVINAAKETVIEPEPAPVPSASAEGPSPAAPEPAPAPAPEPEPAPVPSASAEGPSPASPAAPAPAAQPVAPEPAPKAKGESVSIAEHYQEFADERKRTPIIYTLSALLILACIALGWFIFSLDREDSGTYVYNTDAIERSAGRSAEPEVYEEEEAPEVFFGDMSAEAASDETAPEEYVDEATAAELAAAEKAAQEAAAKVEAERIAAEKAQAEKAAAEKAAAEKAEAEKKAAAEKTEAAKPSNASTAGRLKNSDGSYATHKLTAGSRLTLVALEHYGDKCFWPYVYEVNRDKLKSPSLVQPGMVLYLPDPQYFGINANNPESVAKAKAKAAQLLK